MGRGVVTCCALRTEHWAAVRFALATFRPAPNTTLTFMRKAPNGNGAHNGSDPQQKR